MSANKMDNTLPFDLRDSLEGSRHDPAKIVLAVPRDVRHPAMAAIYRQMGLKTPAAQRRARDNLGHLMFDYRRLRQVTATRMSMSKRLDWYYKVSKASSKLIALLTDERAKLNRLPYSVWCDETLLKGLRRLNFSSLHQPVGLKELAKRKDDERGVYYLPRQAGDFATPRLINNLAYWYQAETGKRLV